MQQATSKMQHNTFKAWFLECSLSVTAAFSLRRSSMILIIFSAIVLPVLAFSAPTAYQCYVSGCLDLSMSARSHACRSDATLLTDTQTRLSILCRDSKAVYLGFMCHGTAQLTNDITLELIHVLLGLCNAPIYFVQHGCNFHTLPLTSFLCL